MLFFLRSWRNAIVVMIAIPASLLVTLAAMRLAHFTLDTVSLLAMTLIIGILVDDSIVVLENVERHFRHGEDPATAAIRGRTEIGVAAIVITLVDVVVFLPISFLPGSVGPVLARVRPGRDGRDADVAVRFVHGDAVARGPLGAALDAGSRGAIIGAFAAAVRTAAPLLRPTTSCTGGCATAGFVVVISGALAASLALAAACRLGLVGFEYIPPVDRGELYLTMTLPERNAARNDAPAPARRSNAIVDAVRDLRAESSMAGAYLGQLTRLHQQSARSRRSTSILNDQPRALDGLLGRATAERRAQGVVPSAVVVSVPATDISGGNAQPIDEVVSSVDGNPEP